MLASARGLSCYIYFGQHLRRGGPGTVDTVGQRNCYVLWIQTDGVTILERGSDRWELRPGEVFLAEPGVVARFQAPARVTRLVFDLVGREREVDPQGKAMPRTWSPQPDWRTLFGGPWRPRVPEQWDRRVKELVAEGTMANRADDPGRWLVITQRLGLWLAEYARAMAAGAAELPSLGHHSLVAAADELFRRCFDPKPSVAAVARRLGVSRGHLTRVYQQLRGHGPGHARLLLQIAHAKQLLREGRS